jgi:hypothetical protein
MLTQDQLNATYREVLGRDAPTSDLAAWNNVGGSINDYRNALLDTGEYKDRWAGVTASRNALGRDPTADELGQLVVPTSVYRNASGADLSGTTSYLTDMLKQSGPGAFSRPPGTQPLPAAQPPAFQTPRQPGYTHNIRGLPGYAPAPGQTQMPGTGGQRDWLGGILGQLFGAGRAGGRNTYDVPPGGFGPSYPPGEEWRYGATPDMGSGMGGGGGQYDFGGIWSKGPTSPYPGDGMGDGMSRTTMKRPGGNQLADLFGASLGQFGSGAMGGQQTNAMSNPLSASPFGRNFSTRQMGIPARTMI